MSELPPIMPGSVPPRAPVSGPLKFRGRGRDLLSRDGLIALLCAVTVVGLPYSLVLYYRWIARKTETANGNTFTFKGGVGLLYALIGSVVLLSVMEQVVLFLVIMYRSGSPIGILPLLAVKLPVQFAVGSAFYFLLARYFLANLRDAQQRKADFRAPFWGFVGRNILFNLSVFTIIGWAWVMCWYIRWVLRHTLIEGARIRFTATGLGVLWRAIAFTICCVPIVTAPWATARYYRWFFSMIEIYHESGPEAARLAA
jgi:hypothetical protein